MEENKLYRIPHNYKNNGRIFNMFERAQVKKALCVIAPMMILVSMLPASLTIKAFVGVYVVVLPAAIFLFELDRVVWDMYVFQHDRHIYTEEKGAFIYEIEKKKSF